MEEPKKNKAMRPEPPDGPPERLSGPDVPKAPGMVRIRFRAGRAAEGVRTDHRGEAVVEEGLARYLVSINYADEVKES